MAKVNQRRNPLRATTAGIEFIGTFGLLLAGGYALDRLLNITPALTIWGGVIGFIYALRRLLKQAKKAGKDVEEDWRQHHQDQRH